MSTINLISDLTAIGLIATVFYAYLYWGRLIFQRPTQITFSTLEMGATQKIKKDIIAIPLAIQNTGALSTSFQVALLVKFSDKGNSGEFQYNGHNEPYAVLTNDFEVKNLNYSKMLKLRNEDHNVRFQDGIDLNYSTGFALKGRNTELKLCIFCPVNNELRFPVSDYGGEAIEMSLLYRKNIPNKKKVGKLRKSRKCENNIHARPDSGRWKWRRAFDIRWKIPAAISELLNNGSSMSVTRFEFHPTSLRRKFCFKIPTLLMCEDV